MKQILTRLSGAFVCCALPLCSLVPAVAAAAGGPGAPAPAAAAKPVGGLAFDSLTTAAHPTLLKGTVVLRTGQPCAGASVYVAGAPRQLVVTNAQGAFTIPTSAGAAIVLYIDYFGEGTSRVKVSLPATEPLRITLGQ